MNKKHEAPLVYANYKRIQKKILKTLTKDGVDPTTISLLDWGGHDGVLSQLFIQDGVTDVTLYDVGESLPVLDVDRFPGLRQVKTAHSTDVTTLPFHDDSFDVVLSVGVLEHVPFMSDSLKELHRVLKPNGALFIFHFPNRWSWTEWIASWHRLSGHARKLTMRELHTALVCNGFDVESSWRFNFFPKTFYPLPPFVIRFVSLFTPLIYWFDSILSSIPFLNQLCNSNEYFSKAKSVLR